MFVERRRKHTAVFACCKRDRVWPEGRGAEAGRAEVLQHRRHMLLRCVTGAAPGGPGSVYAHEAWSSRGSFFFFSDSSRCERSVGETDLLYTRTQNTYERATTRHSSLQNEACCGRRCGQGSTSPGAPRYDGLGGSLCACVFRERAKSRVGRHAFRHGCLTMRDRAAADCVSGSLELEYTNLFLSALVVCGDVCC